MQKQTLGESAELLKERSDPTGDIRKLEAILERVMEELLEIDATGHDPHIRLIAAEARGSIANKMLQLSMEHRQKLLMLSVSGASQNTAEYPLYDFLKQCQQRRS